MEKVIVKLEIRYNNLNFRKNGLVELTFKSSYDNIVSTLKLVQLINTNITIKAKIKGEIFTLGNYYIKNIGIDRDGESTIKFGSEVESVEYDSLNALNSVQIPIEVVCVGIVDTNPYNMKDVSEEEIEDEE